MGFDASGSCLALCFRSPHTLCEAFALHPDRPGLPSAVAKLAATGHVQAGSIANPNHKSTMHRARYRCVLRIVFRSLGIWEGLCEVASITSSPRDFRPPYSVPIASEMRASAQGLMINKFARDAPNSTDPGASEQAAGNSRLHAVVTGPCQLRLPISRLDMAGQHPAVVYHSRSRVVGEAARQGDLSPVGL